MGSNPSDVTDVGGSGPLECVSWDHAMAFCKKLTERERQAGQLPETSRAGAERRPCEGPPAVRSPIEAPATEVCLPRSRIPSMRP